MIDGDLWLGLLKPAAHDPNQGVWQVGSFSMSVHYQCWEALILHAKTNKQTHTHHLLLKGTCASAISGSHASQERDTLVMESSLSSQQFTESINTSRSR